MEIQILNPPIVTCLPIGRKLKPRGQNIVIMKNKLKNKNNQKKNQNQKKKIQWIVFLK